MVKKIFDFLRFFHSYLQESILNIEIGWQNGPYIHIQSHEQLIKNKQDEYIKLSKELARLEFIEYVLRDSGEIQFIIFSPPDLGSYFVQFNRSKGQLYLDVPATSFASNSFERQKQIITMLSDAGFKKNSTSSLKFKQYVKVDMKSMRLIRADFQKDYELASNFVDSIFTRVFLTEEKVGVKIL